MPRTKISEFSATAADNTDIDSIDIAEGCAPSGINNAIRELMAQLKDFQTGAASDPFNGAVNGTLGATTPAAATITNLAYTGTLTGGTGVINIGSGQIYKDASGNVGINNTSPNGKFHVTGGTTNASNLATAYSAAAFTLTPKSTSGYSLAFGSGPSDYPYIQMSAAGSVASNMTLQPYGGNVGIGTISPQANLAVSNGGAAGLEFFSNYPGGGVGTYIQSYNRSGAAYVNTAYDALSHAFNISGTERAQIDSSGNLLVGKTVADFTTQGCFIQKDGTFNSAGPTGVDFLNCYSTSAGAYRFYVTNAGTVNATTNTITSISDVRFKENIRDLDVGLDKIMALKPRLYDWKKGKGADIKNSRGFIAQEFETVFPDLIDEWREPAPEGEEPYKAIRQDLIPVLVKAIQEQQALIQDLTTRLTTLEGN